MGVGGGFWEMLRPIANREDLDWLRGKKLAIDLSYWIVQQGTAVKGNVRKPHLRLLFFRTINLVAKLGAFPVFVVDGEAPPQKLQARLERFSRMSGISLSIAVEEASLVGHNATRNIVFTQNIEECVELLQLLGMPVVRAKREAEGLCAELNRQGFVDACVTPDGDAFLYGAKCVIKQLQADFRDPLVETYSAADIESVLGLHREHLIALALLAGCDYNMQGVTGIGCNNAMRLVCTIPKQDILDRLRAWGEGKASSFVDMHNATSTLLRSGKDDENGEVKEMNLDVPVKKELHCSYCGHPGTKKIHAKNGCKACNLDGSDDDSEQGCRPKAWGFKCTCFVCIKDHRRKLHIKQEVWRLKLCKKVAATNGFPDEHIIQIYLNSEDSNLADNKHGLSSLSRQAPQMEALEIFLGEHLHWDFIYVRQKVLPLLSQIWLQERANMKKAKSEMLPCYRGLLNGLYFPDSIERTKIFYSRPLYRLRWKQTAHVDEDWLGLSLNQSKDQRIDGGGGLDDLEERRIGLASEFVDSCMHFTTDEDMTLVKDACPELVEIFEDMQDAKLKRRKKICKRKNEQELVPVNKQPSIKSFFKVKKELVKCEDMPADEAVVEDVKPVARADLHLFKADDYLAGNIVRRREPGTQHVTMNKGDNTPASSNIYDVDGIVLGTKSFVKEIRLPIRDSVKRRLFLSSS
eukprot:c920_g1_i1 orf=520-2589(-)